MRWVAARHPVARVTYDHPRTKITTELSHQHRTGHSHNFKSSCFTEIKLCVYLALKCSSCVLRWPAFIMVTDVNLSPKSTFEVKSHCRHPSARDGKSA